jgi:hypothetical protein
MERRLPPAKHLLKDDYDLHRAATRAVSEAFSYIFSL